MIEHRIPTDSTVKFLYAHAFRCAFKGCRRPLYRMDEQTSVRTLNSRVCHIHARREGGPRWDASQSAEDNRGPANLVLMCVEHASAIDNPATVSAYPPELLLEWKARQLEEHDRLQQGWGIDSAMAHEVIEASFSNVGVVITGAAIDLGGKGGMAAQAGGGGGAAVGPGSRGGDGGRGGGRQVDSGEFTLPYPDDVLKQLRDRYVERGETAADPHPGAGGGGEGEFGPGLRGGDGGDGGDATAALIDVAALDAAGFDHAEVVIGEGGVSSPLPGAHGRDGQDTILKFMPRMGAF